MYSKLLNAAVLATLSTTALANFHIGKADKEQNPFSDGFPPFKFTQWIACPSNYYGCKCYGYIAANADRGVQTSDDRTPEGHTTFSLNAGLCGMGKLDFYYRQAQNVWEFYVSGGDGSLQGTCFDNRADLDWCSRDGTALTTIYDDKLVCYSYICGE